MSKLTDDEYIEKIRKSYKSRKKTITILVATAVIITIPLLYFYSQLQTQINIYIANLNSMDQNVTDSALKETDEIINYYIGFLIGSTFTGLVVVVSSAFAYALNYHLNSRKHSLLLKYYDLSKK